jgi:hypothetical protein
MQKNALGQIHEILAPLLRAAPIIFSYQARTGGARQSHTAMREAQKPPAPRNSHNHHDEYRNNHGAGPAGSRDIQLRSFW